MDFIKAKGRSLVLNEKKIALKGVGLGGWLLPEGYMWKFKGYYDRPRRIENLIDDLCGSDYSSRFWNDYFSSFVREEDFVRLARWGFNSVRLPFNSRLLFSGEDLNPAYLSHLDDAVKWGRKYGLLIFLDCHAAPGGQTGKNIDDSEKDYPALFESEKNKDDLVRLWRLLAERYKDEESIGGYDLLNEPITKDHDEFSPCLVPLYRRLIKEIRKVDPNHLIVLEGTHWSTDFSIFQELNKQEAQDNLLFEFHKYWNAPDRASLVPYLALREQLDVPLWDGESGENNLYWYSLLFPLLEREEIGWSFWTYKKMSNRNSLLSFAKPKRWNEVLSYEKNGGRVQNPREIFDQLLLSIQKGTAHPETARALLRLSPTFIAPESYDKADVKKPKKEIGVFRKEEPVSVVFSDGHSGSPDFAKYGGQRQKEKDRMRIILNKNDEVSYSFASDEAKIRIQIQGKGAFSIQIDRKNCENNAIFHLGKTKERHILSLIALEDGTCIDGIVLRRRR